MKYLFISCFILPLFACSSVSAVDKYYREELQLIGQKYNMGDISANYLPNMMLAKECHAKTALKAIEYLVATQPDSTKFVDTSYVMPPGIHMSVQRIDSFYSHKNKIDYLIKNNLVGSRKFYNQ